MVARPDFEQAQRRRSLDRQRNDEVTAKIVKYTAFVTTLEPGSAVTDLTFPVLFTQIPSINASSWHLADNQVLEVGNTPTCHGGVHHFETVELVPGVLYYRGARVSISTTGPAGMVLVVHVQFEGTALVNPLTPPGGIV